MTVLVDTSIWIDYFRSGNNSQRLDNLIDENLIVTNDLILAELIPFLRIRKQRKTINLLLDVKKLALSIDWEQIIEYQYKCLKKGLSGVGIPDLLIAQNAKQHHSEIYSLDNHLHLMKDILDLHIVTSNVTMSLSVPTEAPFPWPFGRLHVRFYENTMAAKVTKEFWSSTVV